MLGPRQIIGRFLGGDDEEAEDPYSQFRLESISPNIVVIPNQDDVTETDVRYPLIKPFADAHVYWDEEKESLIYEVDEPSLTGREEHIFDELRDALEEKIDVPLSELDTTEKIVSYLQSQIEDTAIELGYQLSAEEENKIMYYVYRNFAGINEIEPLMHDPHIEDIGCSGIGIPVYVVHSKFGSIQSDIVFEDEGNLKNLVVKLAERASKYVSYAEPLLDGTLPDGSRVNASLTHDVTTKGPTFSIRKFQEVPYSAIDLIDMGTANYELMAYMWMAMQYQKSMLVIGGTATGKTTFLNSIVTFIPPEHKIVSIEDTRELQLPHENWIPSVTRTGMGADSDDQEINMYELLRESFRQNPDYVVVGETRGKEASVLFQGMASGHPSLSTMHASAPSDVVSRLTTPPINLSPALIETLDVIVAVTHASEYGKNARRVNAVYEVEDVSGEGSLRTNEYISWTAIDDSFDVKADSTVLDRVQQQFGMTRSELEQELEDRKEVLRLMHENGISQFSQVSGLVSEYYNDKDAVLQALQTKSGQQIEQLLQRDAGPGVPEHVTSDVEVLEEELARDTSASRNAKQLDAPDQPASLDEPRDGSAEDTSNRTAQPDDTAQSASTADQNTATEKPQQETLQHPDETQSEFLDEDSGAAPELDADVADDVSDEQGEDEDDDDPFDDEDVDDVEENPFGS